MTVKCLVYNGAIYRSVYIKMSKNSMSANLEKQETTLN